MLVLVVGMSAATTGRERVWAVAVDAPTTAAEHTPETRRTAAAPAMATLSSDRAEPGSDRRRMTESSDEKPMQARYRWRDGPGSRRMPARGK